MISDSDLTNQPGPPNFGSFLEGKSPYFRKTYYNWDKGMFLVILVLFSGRIPVCIGGILASQTIIGSCLAVLGPVLL